MASQRPRFERRGPLPAGATDLDPERRLGGGLEAAAGSPTSQPLHRLFCGAMLASGISATLSATNKTRQPERDTGLLPSISVFLRVPSWRSL